MKAWNGEINWYCPEEQSLMANDIRGLMAPKFPCHLSYTWGKNLGKNRNQENWPDRGSNPGPLGERQRCYRSTTAVVDMYRMAWYPESSCEIDENLKEVDRQWRAQKLIFFNFINTPFRAVKFDITSVFDSVASFCYGFAQLGTNCSLHKELPTPGLPVSSLVHTLNDKYCHYFSSTRCCIVWKYCLKIHHLLDNNKSLKIILYTYLYVIAVIQYFFLFILI